jgi:hypothetical protein
LLVLLREGSLGIGTTTPAYTLDVNGTCRFTNGTNPYVALYNGSNTAYLQVSSGDLNLVPPSSGNTTFSAGGGEAVRIDTNKRLLVGTSSTSEVGRAVFQGNSAFSTGTSIVKLTLGNASPGSADELGKIQFADSSHVSAAQIAGLRDGGTWTSGSSHPTRLVFSTTADGAASPTERMRIT